MALTFQRRNTRRKQSVITKFDECWGQTVAEVENHSIQVGGQVLWELPISFRTKAKILTVASKADINAW